MALPKISTVFTEATRDVSQEKKIIELQSEIEQLRKSATPEVFQAEIEKLRAQLLTKSGEIEIDVSLIDPNLSQPRQTITDVSIQIKARSLKRYGQISPIILVPSGERYTLLDGQLRWLSARLLGWSTIRAVVVPMPEDLNHSSLLTFLGFEDLNPLDKAEAIVREISKCTGLNDEEIYTTLSTAIKRIQRDDKLKDLSSLIGASDSEQGQLLRSLLTGDSELEVFLILIELGLNPNSFRVNLMPMLFLPQDLKDAIRVQGLKGGHALALGGLTSKVLQVKEEVAISSRIDATSQVLNKNLSVPETRKLVNQIKAKYLNDTVRKSKEIKSAIAKLEKLEAVVLSDASNGELQSFKEVLERKLAEVNKLMS